MVDTSSHRGAETTRFTVRGQCVAKAETQDQSAPGMPPAYALQPVDWQHGEAGRLIYNCEAYKFAGGGLCK